MPPGYAGLQKEYSERQVVIYAIVDIEGNQADDGFRDFRPGRRCRTIVQSRSRRSKSRLVEEFSREKQGSGEQADTN
jgi:hypothetical protein